MKFETEAIHFREMLEQSAGPTNAQLRRKLEQALNEYARRKTETTQIYEPLPNQLAFHKCPARERMLVGSNRAGKTLTAAMEAAWILTNRHPHRKPREGGIAWIVGKDESHIGGVLMPKLFDKQQAFRRIRDLETGLWRPYKPWIEQERFAETEPMDALIPKRMIKHISWNARSKNVPYSIDLFSGWKVYFYTGAGRPRAGQDIDFAWFDEEIENQQWYVETASRLLDRSGDFVWSCTPQEGGASLYNLHLRAEDERERAEVPIVEEFTLLLDDNPYIAEKEKNNLKEKFKHDPDAYRVRIKGEYLSDSNRVYPTFNVGKHCIPPEPIPQDWMRVMVVDPGTTVSAVLFLAMPPDESHLVCYDELYLQDCDPQTWGKRVTARCEGQHFERFIIDDNGSRKRDASSGVTVRSVYANQLSERRIKCRRTGSDFELGKSNLVSGLDAVRLALQPRENSNDERPWLQIMYSPGIGELGCPKLVWELERYQKQRRNGVLTDKPVDRHDHLCDCLRYAAMANLTYRRPGSVVTRVSSRVARILKERRNQGSGGILLGAGKFKD